MENPLGALRASVDRLHALTSGLDDDQQHVYRLDTEWQSLEYLRI